MVKINRLQSPNFSSRKGKDISLIVLHYTGMKTGAEALERLCDAKSEVSAHYVIEEDGRIFQLVDEENKAWHAGASYWHGHENVNDISIGIEIVNPGHEFGYRPFPAIQMQAVATLCADIIARRKIPAHNVVGHSDVAPIRKTDPGELFDWQFLAGQGIGLWPKAGRGNTEKKTYNLADIAQRLAQYGYQPSGDDEQLKKNIEAFQRRFRPETINGVWDGECDELLAALLKMI